MISILLIEVHKIERDIFLLSTSPVTVVQKEVIFRSSVLQPHRLRGNLPPVAWVVDRIGRDGRQFMGVREPRCHLCILYRRCDSSGNNFLWSTVSIFERIGSQGMCKRLFTGGRSYRGITTEPDRAIFQPLRPFRGIHECMSEMYAITPLSEINCYCTALGSLSVWSYANWVCQIRLVFQEIGFFSEAQAIQHYLIAAAQLAVWFKNDLQIIEPSASPVSWLPSILRVIRFFFSTMFGVPLLDDGTIRTIE